MTNDTVSIREVYTLVDNKFNDVNRSVLRLEEKVDDLGSNRISMLEKAVANLQGRMMYIPAVISVAISGFFFIVDTILKK